MNAISVAAAQYAVSDIERMARAFAVSKLFGVTNPEQAIALCLIAQAEGRHPASAAQDYHIIQGRPAKKADAMLRDFLAGGGKVEWHALDDTVADATFSHPSGGSVRITWDMPRAVKADLKTPMWRKYPRQMLRARVVSEGVRTVFPMATSGMYVPEEVQDFDPPKDAPKPDAGQVIEGEATEPAPEVKALPKAQSRGTFDRLVKATRECASIADFDKLWQHPRTIEAYETLPHDWKGEIDEEKRDKLAELDERAALQSEPVDPNEQFDRMEQERVS